MKRILNFSFLFLIITASTVYAELTKMEEGQAIGFGIGSASIIQFKSDEYIGICNDSLLSNSVFKSKSQEFKDLAVFECSEVLNKIKNK
jgi:hypothetical protein